MIRVAGNIVAPSQVGSVEFAAARFGTRLVVVLGHSRCGAILATLEELQQPTAPVAATCARSSTGSGRRSRRCWRPSSGTIRRPWCGRPCGRTSGPPRNHLRHGSDVLEQLIQEEGLLVVGAEYSLETGVVEFFDEP